MRNIIDTNGTNRRPSENIRKKPTECNPCRGQTEKGEDVRYALIGEKLSYSRSPEIHRLISGIDYGLAELSPCEATAFVIGKNFDFINVTAPYKRSVVPYLDELSEEAGVTGTVNTIVNRHGRLIGYNTDVCGLSALIRRTLGDIRGSTVLILGSGGTSHTAAYVCEKSGANHITVGRRAKENVIDYGSAIREYSHADIIINTTPLGTSPAVFSSAVDLAQFDSLHGVIDVVYNPVRSSLILQGKDLGIPCAGGLYMLFSQAAEAERVAGISERHDIDGIYDAYEKGICNIFLTGMPGCGKSTVGKMLAEKLSRPFFDLDAMIEKREGCDISSIFLRGGEKHFREIENEVFGELCLSVTGAVISTGGGTVLNPKNRQLMHMTGTVYYIDRDLNSLALSSERPLARTADDLIKLGKERENIYRLCADRIIRGGTEDSECTEIAEDFSK